MYRFFTIIVCITSLLVATPGNHVSADEVTKKILTIQIPVEIDTEHLIIEKYASRGHINNKHKKNHFRPIGRKVPIRGERGKFRYDIDLSNIEYFVALLYCPGYRIETLEFNIKDRDLSKPWVPPFKKLPITSLNGRLVDSRNRPIKDVKLVLYYDLHEVVHFDGQMDRSVPRLYIASALTDDVGAFSMNVPTLLDDPFIINNKWHFAMS